MKDAGNTTVYVLICLIAACADGDSDSQEASIDTDIELPNPSESSADVFTRLQTCEIDEATESRIRGLAERLDELLIRYTEAHPDVVATRAMLDELEQRALGNCVESLQ